MKKLIGKTILITRPSHQSQTLSDAIQQQGGVCVHFPCIEIIKPNDQLTLNQALQHLDQFDVCIFTSVNAAAVLENHHKKPQKAIAIGPATAAALQQLSINHSIPKIYNSVGILSLPILQNVEDKKIALFTGENPKPLLYETLRQRGAAVDLVFCYKRICPTYTAADIEKITKTDIDFIITTSSDSLKNLNKIFQNHHAWLINHPLLVISDNMQKQAMQLGFSNLYQARSADYLAIMDCLLAIVA